MGFLVRNPKKALLYQYILFVFLILIILGGLTRILLNDELVISLITMITGIIGASLAVINRDLAVSRIASKLSIYCSKGEFEKAFRLINKKINSNILGYNPNWYALKAMVLVKKGEQKEAENILYKLKENYPSFSHVFYFIACIESIRGNRKKTLRYLDKVFKIQNEHLKRKKSPISRRTLKKKTENLLLTVRKDEDLDSLHGTTEFKKLLSKNTREEESDLGIKTAFIFALTITITFTFLLWVQYSRFFPLITGIGFFMTFVLMIIIHKFGKGI